MVRQDALGAGLLEMTGAATEVAARLTAERQELG